MTYKFPTFVPRVAKSLFSAKIPFLVSPFKSEDFPALVYPTIPIVGMPFFLRDSLWSFLIFAYSLSLSSIFLVFSFKCLFMISVLVSPDPLVAPAPHEADPPCFERIIPIP